MKFNGSELPNELLLYSQNTSTKIEFDSENIAKIISSLDLNKAHGHDMLSIPISKLCGKPNYNLLQ